MSKKEVGYIYSTDLVYPSNPPYNPSSPFPEYPLKKKDISSKPNIVYNSIRELFYILGMDEKNYGKQSWNPLKDVIKPGDTVLIKPNFVFDIHKNSGDIYSIITHPSVIRAVIDYSFIALQGTGRIIIADSPQADCDFNNIMKFTGLRKIIELYKRISFNIDIFDIRKNRVHPDRYGFISKSKRQSLKGDPNGYQTVRLGSQSELNSLKNLHRVYGADYDRSETLRHHQWDNHEYCISNTVLSSDVIISIPKMKVHKKQGVSLNLKNMVGISGNMNFLPHYRIGAPRSGGDEFPDETSSKIRFYFNIYHKLIDLLMAKENFFLEKIFFITVSPFISINKAGYNTGQQSVHSGNWYGNDTLWRMILDLNKIVFFSDKQGHMKKEKQRRYFSIIDGVIGGENDGPLLPDSKKSKIIIGGFNPASVDIIATRLMGFDEQKINLYAKLKQIKSYKFIKYTNIESIPICSNTDNLSPFNFNKTLKFSPYSSWKGKIELENTK